ncbi:hypothetical protein GCM10010909_27320 [Acidocella aquatica]|uniref:Uncharacterized protein n=1 Tax=Acidocella aquatica TaxID=1922313 RepID=A0ABQ6A839_9PROT|nr:hypothetical protein [Acidocella aquatica]GLR68051.1 hypothetical protein GCM10010909_27320 [Acidocella aquatica]
MSDARRPNPSNEIMRRKWVRQLRDALLLPPALLYVIIEEIFWNGATALLRQIARTWPVRALQKQLMALPAPVILPLFLVPEILSHIGGFWAAYLVTRGEWAAAMVAGIVIKGSATLMVVWIYQSCERKLLSIRWFAVVHRQALRGRDWVLEKIRPGKELALRLLRRSRAGIIRRFAAIRQVLAARLGFRRRS